MRNAPNPESQENSPIPAPLMQGGSPSPDLRARDENIEEEIKEGLEVKESMHDESPTSLKS